MSLYRLNNWLNGRINNYNNKVSYLQSQIGMIPAWQHRYLTESLISDIWLTWCWFSRVLIHKSLRGTKARDNRVVAGRSGDNSWQRIGHECSKAAKLENHRGALPANFLMRREPTWGDIGCLIKMITALAPANQNQLLTAFGLPLQGPKHVQLVRNCAAHKTVENLFSLRAEFALVYSIPRIATPAEIAWAQKIGTTDLAIDLWLHEMRVIADVATATA